MHEKADFNYENSGIWLVTSQIITRIDNDEFPRKKQLPEYYKSKHLEYYLLFDIRVLFAFGISLVTRSCDSLV